jgi:hypothetical protein
MKRQTSSTADIENDGVLKDGRVGEDKVAVGVGADLVCEKRNVLDVKAKVKRGR